MNLEPYIKNQEFNEDIVATNNKAALSSVRDDITYNFLENLGYDKAINTGCPALHLFDNEFRINDSKKVLLTFPFPMVNNDSDEDTSDSFDANMGLSNQEVNQASANSLSQAAINSANTDQSQSPDSQSYFASTDVPNAMDFNFANSNAARDIRDNMDQGSVFRDPQNPVSSAINYLSKIGPQNTYNNLSMGQVPTRNAQGQITGTTGQGFGMASGPGSPNPYGPEYSFAQNLMESQSLCHSWHIYSSSCCYPTGPSITTGSGDPLDFSLFHGYTGGQNHGFW